MVGIRRLTRGTATPRDLSDALDQIDIQQGDAFLIARPEALDTAATCRPPLTEPDSNRLGGFTGSTSRRAALDNYPRSGTQRWHILQALARRRDWTSDELAAELSMRLYSVKPRLIELREGGWATRTGATRPSVTGSAVDVYRITQKGFHAVTTDA